VTEWQHWWLSGNTGEVTAVCWTADVRLQVWLWGWEEQDPLSVRGGQLLQVDELIPALLRWCSNRAALMQQQVDAADLLRWCNNSAALIQQPCSTDASALLHVSEQCQAILSHIVIRPATRIPSQRLQVLERGCFSTFYKFHIISCGLRRRDAILLFMLQARMICWLCSCMLLMYWSTLIGSVFLVKCAICRLARLLV
jgi:hypothetical protein